MNTLTSLRSVLSSFLLVGVSIGTAACAANATDEASALDAPITEGAGSTVAIASDLPEHCRGPEIARIDRPVVSDDPTKGTWSYAYRYKAPTRAGAPVLVSLPGGPGGTAIGTAPDWLPEGWGYLLTDPRGVGCNGIARVPDEELSARYFRTTEIAGDVLAAIEKEQLRDHVIYGVSYGTLLATHVTHEIETRGLPAPRAVVLEGVLGRAFDREFVGAEYIRQWDRIRAVLPADVLEELDTKDAPYGIDANGWSLVLMQFLPHGPNVVANHIAALSPTNELPQETRDGVLSVLRGMASEAPHSAPADVELFRQVACRELTDTTPAGDLDVVFQRGKLVRNAAEEGTKCRGVRLTTPFDATDHPFSTKTYYFIGESDVATPAWQGDYHFEAHRGSAVKIVTKNGGHNPLRLDQGECAPMLMASIESGGKDIDAVLASCPQPVETSRK